jgi:hypothetical protein
MSNTELTSGPRRCRITLFFLVDYLNQTPGPGSAPVGGLLLGFRLLGQTNGGTPSPTPRQSLCSLSRLLLLHRRSLYLSQHRIQFAIAYRRDQRIDHVRQFLNRLHCDACFALVELDGLAAKTEQKTPANRSVPSATQLYRMVKPVKIGDASPRAALPRVLD